MRSTQPRIRLSNIELLEEIEMLETFFAERLERPAATQLTNAKANQKNTVRGEASL